MLLLSNVNVNDNNDPRMNLKEKMKWASVSLTADWNLFFVTYDQTDQSE